VDVETLSGGEDSGEGGDCGRWGTVGGGGLGGSGIENCCVLS
jgi:hypothetical protein